MTSKCQTWGYCRAEPACPKYVECSRDWNDMTTVNPSDHSNGIMPPFKTFDEFIDHITTHNISDREILVNMAFQMNKVYHLIDNLMTNSPLGAMVAGGLPPGFPIPPGMAQRLPG